MIRQSVKDGSVLRWQHRNMNTSLYIKITHHKLMQSVLNTVYHKEVNWEVNKMQHFTYRVYSSLKVLLLKMLPATVSHYHGK